MSLTVSITDRDRLESDFLDKYDLAGVLDALSIICSDKADHASEAWQDYTLANLWNRCRRILTTAVSRPAVMSVSGDRTP